MSTREGTDWQGDRQADGDISRFTDGVTDNPNVYTLMNSFLESVKTLAIITSNRN